MRRRKNNNLANYDDRTDFLNLRNSREIDSEVKLELETGRRLKMFFLCEENIPSNRAVM